MEYRLKNENIESYNAAGGIAFPKYTSQLMNWANQNAQGTRPAVVGQMSELFQQFMEAVPEMSVENWRDWYLADHPDAMDKAADKIFMQVENLRAAIQLIDRNMVRSWVEDLVVNKTYNGLYIQKAILASLAEKLGKTYRLAEPEEESKGIDGFVGDTAYSIKPDSYKTMGRLSETIDVKMIYYTKTKTGLKLEIED